MENMDNAISTLLEDVKVIKEQLNSLIQSQSSKISDNWLDSQEVLILLHMSKRKLQYLRDRNILPFSRINGKMYYKTTDILSLLESNYKDFKTIIPKK